MNARVRRSVGIAIGCLLGAAAPASAGFSYGPIIGRGTAPDSVVIRWGTSSSAPTELDYRVKSGTYTTQSGSAGIDHEIVLIGLQPSKLYDYVAHSGADQVTATFSTCPTPLEPLEVVAYGDMRGGASEHQQLVARMHELMPDVVLNTGDIVPDGKRSQYLSEFFPIAGSMVKEVAYLAAPGNHDFRTSFSSGFGSVFPLPATQGGGKRPYYMVTCGNAAFISLDANNPDDNAQRNFLEDALTAARENPNVQHVFAFLHHSPYSSADNHGDQYDVREAFSPLLEDPDNKVSIVFSGHDHVYERIEAGGITYIVTGGGGADLYDYGEPTQGGVSRRFESTHHFVRLSIAGAHIAGTVVRQDGTVLETFAVDSDVATPPDDGKSDAGAAAPDAGDGTDPSGSDDGGSGGGDDRDGQGGCSVAGGGARQGLLALGLIAVFAPVVSRRTRKRLRSRA